MTNALCLNCGRMKLGALCPCQQCGYIPQEREQNQYVMATDHFYSTNYLVKVGQDIQAGKLPFLDPAEMEKYYKKQRLKKTIIYTLYCFFFTICIISGVMANSENPLWAKSWVYLKPLFFFCLIMHIFTLILIFFLLP